MATYNNIKRIKFGSNIYNIYDNSNLLNGSTDNSIRTVESKPEDNNYTIGLNAVATGFMTAASGYNSHAEGYSTTASGHHSHAEGYSTTASGDCSHAEGDSTTASNDYSHAEGSNTVASGYCSHVEGSNTVASCDYQTVIGTANIEKDEPFIIGNGTSSAPSNALTVDWDGRIHCGNYIGTFQSIFDIFYPVGSYYETSDSDFNPNNAWGGTWSLETEGQFHVSAGYNYTVNGALSNTSDGGSEYVQEHTHSFTNPTINNHAAAACTRTAGVALSGHTHEMGYKNTDRQSGSSTTRQGPFGSTTSGVTKINTASTTVSVATQPTFNTPVLSHSYSANGSVGNINTSGLTTGSAGNMPPYIVVYRWHRTA